MRTFFVSFRDRHEWLCQVIVITRMFAADPTRHRIVELVHDFAPNLERAEAFGRGHPFVSIGEKEIASDRFHIDRHTSQTLDAIDAEQDSALAANLRERLDGHAKSRRVLHERNGNEASALINPCKEIIHKILAVSL